MPVCERYLISGFRVLHDGQPGSKGPSTIQSLHRNHENGLRKVERNVKRISRRNYRRTNLTIFLCLATLFPASNAIGQSNDQPSQPFDVQASRIDSSADAVSLAVDSITEPELKRHIDFLASDTLQGREAGMQGNYAAGAYIADQLRKSNVPPVTSDEGYFRYFQPNFRNILALVPGSDPQLKDEFILVGAHYDHVGFGNQTNSRGPFGVVHNGADDNASGTAGVLEVAQALAALKKKPKRSILIAFWDGEEKGLLGSKAYVNFPAVSLSKIRFHLNADMIGRLRPDGLEISGWQTATACRQFLSEQNADGLKLHFMYTYKPESDHWPFFERRVPSLMLHTGKHPDYHRPSDDTHLLNMDGVRTVSRFILRCTIAAANADSLPAFRNWSNEAAEAFAQRFEQPIQNQPSRLGVTYNATLVKEGTIRLTSIAGGSPANVAGLQVDDEVLAVGHMPTTESNDFRSLVMSAPTETVFKIRRAESELDRPVTLRGNPDLYGFRWIMDDAEPGSAIITHTIADSPAAVAKLRPQHRIRSFNKETFGTRAAFEALLLNAEFPIRLEVELDGRFEILTIGSSQAKNKEATSSQDSESESRDKK